MYTRLITKMTNHFSELGSLIYSKACDYSGLYPISKDDIMMYYNILKSQDITLPEKISRNNHISCCLFYLSKDDASYKDKFLEKFLRTMSINNLPINDENLILVFNIIEFDKTYLNSPKDHILFLYQILRAFSNFPTNFENFIIYKYFRGFLKFRIGEYENTNKEYLEIISELSEVTNPNFFINYLKLRNDLLKVKLYHFSKTSKQEVYEYYQILKDLYDEVKKTNNILAIRLGFDLFSAYFEGKKYADCIPLLIEMKKLLKKELLKGATLKNGIDYYLAIASRLGYIGILLDNKKAINSALKKIKKTLDIIRYDKNNEKLVNLVKAFTFVQAILEVSLTKRTDFDLKTLAYDFQKCFIPDLNNRSPIGYIVNKENKDSTIIDFKVVNNMNTQITNTAKDILNRCVGDIQKKNFKNSTFLIFISAVHDKVYCNSESYISDSNEKMRKYYKEKIIDYANGALNFIYKLLDDEPLLYTQYVKTMIIEILSAYSHIFIYDKNLDQIRRSINTMDDLKKKLKIEDNMPACALINKIKGDFWLYKKDFKAAILYYENALKLFENNDPKVPPCMFNLGSAYFFNGNKSKANEYLNRCISEYNNLAMQKNIFDFTPDIESISKKINAAKKLLSQLS